MAFTRFTKNVLNVSALPDRVQNQANALKATFDQAGVDIKTALNALIVELEASTSADNIGADVQSVATKTVQAILNAFEEAIANRYTKTESETLVSEETNDLVADIDVNLGNGVITVTKKDGTQITFDTAIEKVPSKFEIIESGNTYYLRITNLDGTTTQADVTSLMNIYHFTNSDTITFDVTGEGNQKTVTANVKANSIGLDKLELDVVSTLEGYMTSAKNSATAAQTSETNARTSELNALEAKNSALNSAATATTSAQTASNASKTAQELAQTVTTTAQQAKQEITTTANNAKSSVTTAANSATSEITSAVNSAKTELNATATQAKSETNSNAVLAKSYAVGGTGSRAGEDVDNAKYYSEQAKATVSGDYVTRPEFQEGIKNFATEAYVDEALENFDGGITEIPIATADTLGGIKVGEGLEITEDGTLSTDSGFVSYDDYYKEVELLSSPIVYSITNGRGWNNINANIDFVESVDNFDELSFVIELGNDNGYYHVRHHSIKVSYIIYNNSETTVYNGSHRQIPFGIQNIICNLAGWFKTGNRFWAVNIGTYNIVDSGVAFPKVRLRSVKGIKYDITILDGTVAVDNAPIAGSTNVVTSGGVKSYVDTQVATKVDATYVNNAVSSKVDATYVTNAISGKADTTYVNNQISAVNTTLNSKADTSTVNSALAGKADTSTVNTALAGKADTSHTQGAATITAGTFAGQVNANATATATLGTAQVRNISAGTADLTAGTSALATGEIYFVYE